MSYHKQTGESTEPCDEVLAGRAQQGDTAAFDALVKRYEKRLFNYIRRIVGNAADAEDLFQETFLRVHRHIGRFRTSASFRPWLYRIATNLCRDHLRSSRRRLKISLDAPVYGANGRCMLDSLEASTPGPREVAGRHELAERLERALGRLSLKHRSVFLMARYEGMPYEEIARALRIPVGTVKSRMNKAVDVLLREVKEAAE